MKVAAEAPPHDGRIFRRSCLVLRGYFAFIVVHSLAFETVPEKSTSLAMSRDEVPMEMLVVDDMDVSLGGRLGGGRSEWRVEERGMFPGRFSEL